MSSSRLLALLSLLQARRQWPGALLAERLEVTPRTVRRDVDRLRELGYRVDAVKGPDGGYYGDGDGPPRRVEPHALLLRLGRWYLVAWDLDRDDWRVFRLDRLSPRLPHGREFAPRPIPTGDARTFLAAHFKGSEEDRWPCVGEAVVRLPLRDVVPWVGDGEAEELPDGRCRVVIGSWSWTGLIARLVAFDAPFEIVRPRELAEAAATVGERLRSPGVDPR